MFWRNFQKFHFRGPAGPLLFNSKYLWDFPEISQLPEALVVQQLVEELGNSIYSDKNLVLFRLLWREATPKPEKICIFFVRDFNFSLEHLRTTDFEHSQIDFQKCHKLVNCLMLCERINAKPLLTILHSSLNFLTKPVTLLYSFAGQYYYPQTSTFRRKNKTHFTLYLVQNWTSLLPASKSNSLYIKKSEIHYIYIYLHKYVSDL